MKRYVVRWDYGATGGKREEFTATVRGYNQAEAMVRAGARFTQETGRALPDVVENIRVEAHSLHGFRG